MAIALDTTTPKITNGFAVGPTTITWSHICTGSNLLLILNADIWQDTSGSATITAASYNGVALTKVAQVADVNMSAEQWYLAAPASGTNTVSVTVTGAHDAVKLATSSFTGALQVSPLDAFNTANGTTGNPAISLTTLTANVVVVGTLSRFSTTPATTSNISLYNDVTGSILGAADYQLASIIGVYTDTYTGSVTDDWAMVIGSYKPASGTVAVNGATMLMMGI